MSENDLDISKETALGAVLDTVIRKAALLELTDYFIGVEADYAEDRLAIYFLEDAKKETLEELKDSVELENFTTSLDKTEEHGAGWVFQLQKTGEGDIASVSAGEVPVDVSLSGTVDVDAGRMNVKGDEQEPTP